MADGEMGMDSTGDDMAMTEGDDMADDMTDDMDITDEMDSMQAKILSENSPWVTTAIYKQVDGAMDTSMNFITDPEVSKGTISSAQYTMEEFVFVPVDTMTGAFDTSDVDAITSNRGTYEIMTKDGVMYRKIMAKNYSNEREITELTPTKFTYLFSPDGGTTNYYVEHEPYSTVYPEMMYPEELSMKVNEVFMME